MNTNTSKWEYIDGGKDFAMSAQISPDGKYILVREYNSMSDNKSGYTKKVTYKLINVEKGEIVENNESNKGKCDCQCSH